jgi:glycerol uptake facilitator-like aquaporin
VTLARRVAAETLGTCLLVATVIGSGIMAARLAGGQQAVALLANAVATGSMLYVLITMLGPISGAHFNPVVTGVMVVTRAVSLSDGLSYVVAQLAGGILGTIIANVMFETPALQIAQTMRGGLGQWLGEFVATAGLMLTILGLSASRPASIPAAVGLYILSAYWFTSSTSFANPAVTIARVFSDSFAGIAPESVTMFIFMQVTGAAAGLFLTSWLWPPQEPSQGPLTFPARQPT